MKYIIDHDYHIHSHLSLCSKDPEQTNENILKYAKSHGLTSIVLTDHYWDSAIPGASNWYAQQNFDHISKALPLPQDEEVKFLFGCECDMNASRTLGMPLSRFDDFDFVVIPTTHLHMNGFTVSKEGNETPEERADLWVKRLEALLSMPLPFHKVGIAHLACTLIDTKSTDDYLKTLSLIKSTDMHDLFSYAAKLGCGIELNASDIEQVIKYPSVVTRMFNIAKDAGCKFYLGTDSHLPREFNGVTELFLSIIDILGLTEDDKFRLR